MDYPYSFTITDTSIVVIDKSNGRSYTAADTAPNYVPLKRAIEAQDWDAVSQNLEVKKAIETWSKGHFKFEGGKILYRGDEIPGYLGERISSMATKGEDPTPLLKFWEKLQRNPSMRSVEQLYPFLQHQGIPIQSNGNFLAYKGVKSNYTDQHSGTVDNKPGVVNEMPRNKISDDPRKECHYGFHVGDLSYARDFAPTVVVCEVDPSDVVCIPYDNSQRKMRVCKYRVVGNHNGELLPSTTYELESELGTGSEVLPIGDEEDIEEAEAEEKQPELQSVPRYDPDEKQEEPKKKKKPVEKKMKKQRDGDKKVQLKVLKKYQAIHAMGMRELLGETRAVLDEYATRVLHITGASKVVGGKAVLIKQILKVRKNFA